jgi:excisionase family DNA binding protein
VDIPLTVSLGYDGMLTVAEAAARLGIHRCWLYRLCQSGHVASVRTPHGLMVPISEAERSIRRRRPRGSVQAARPG